jgi:futalosine hydrolase
MKILIVAATWMEIKPLEQFLLHADEKGTLQTHAVELMITGPGLVSTAFQLGKNLPIAEWDLAIDAGICGAFSTEMNLGSIVHVTEDRFGDLGAEDEDSFLDAFEINLLDENKFPFQKGWLPNFSLQKLEEKFPLLQKFLEEIPSVKAISVNKVHGNERSIFSIQKKYGATIETMEGAAVHFACALQSQPFIQLRSVSNFIEPRNKDHWNIPLAISNLNKKLIELIALLTQNS